jgi:hypothetical protein
MFVFFIFVFLPWNFLLPRTLRIADFFADLIDFIAVGFAVFLGSVVTIRRHLGLYLIIFFLRLFHYRE